MKIRHIAAVSILTVVFLCTKSTAAAAETEPENLYALSAVLMDGDSGRVLFEKDGDIPRPNASTTKIMTCILALEHAPGDDYVQVSKNAAAQPDVQLNMCEGEQYYLEDLLYSLMLKSHNDTAVAIAEHIAGSVPAFARMMDEKAKAIGCTNTHFITPNGLDAKDSQGEHHTTARDLALMMRYAIQNETFLRITQTRDYSFTDLSKKRQFSVHNANAFLDMMDGMLSGKTGFTGNAGYCYVCACRQNGRTFIVSLLGCGWPNHRSYKWSDTRKLLNYGLANYQYRTFWKEPRLPEILINNRAATISINGKISVTPQEKNRKILLNSTEEPQCKMTLPSELDAPIKKGQKIGQITYTLQDKTLLTCPILAETSVEKIDYLWYVKKVFHDFFH